MAHASGAAHQRVKPLLAQPGAEHDHPARGQRHRDVLVVAIAIRREGQVVKERERLSQQRRQVCGADPGRQVVQEALQGVLVRLDGRAAQGALEQRGDKLHNKRVVGGRHIGHRGSPFASVRASRGYTIPLVRTHGVSGTPASGGGELPCRARAEGQAPRLALRGGPCSP